MNIQKPITLTLLLLLLLPPQLLSNELSIFDYIIQFGDSINDSGNVYWDDHNSLCSNYPYGISLPDSTTPPRCSHGLLIIDYFSKFFNLTINPYLDKKADFKQGVNFAVAGSTALDSSSLSEKQIFSPFTNNSLSTQLTWFRSHLNSICSGRFECKEKLKKSLIFMGEIGGNDYNFAIMMGKSHEELHKLVHDVIAAIKDATNELIKLGASTMVLAGNFPVGCVPAYLNLFQTNDSTKYDDLNCLKELNEFSMFHNNRLQAAIKELQLEHPHVTIIYADYYSALIWLIQNAPSLGFDKDSLQKACCGYGANDYNFDGRSFCGNEGIPVCDDPSKRMSWDGVHFTQHTYQHMSHWLLQHIVPNFITNDGIQVV